MQILHVNMPANKQPNKHANIQIYRKHTNTVNIKTCQI